MIIDPQVGWRRDDVSEYVQQNNFLGTLDVGGAVNHWLNPKPLACLDMVEGDCVLNFQGDISSHHGWEEILLHVAKRGKFDFAVCTHTLEDIRNPQLVLEMLPLVANEGFVSTPCKHTELQIQECDGEEYFSAMNTTGPYKGYIHHRWIFSVFEGVYRVFPKLPCLEVLKGLEWAEELEGGRSQELSFFWKDDIPFETFQNDWLGPNPVELITNYRHQLKLGL